MMHFYIKITIFVIVSITAIIGTLLLVTKISGYVQRLLYQKKDLRLIYKNIKLNNINNKIGLFKSKHDFYIYDFIDRPPLYLFRMRTWNQCFSKLIENKIKKGDCIVDVNTGNGYNALIANQKLGINGEIICIETYLENYELLKNNIHINYINNIKTVHSSISDKKKQNIEISNPKRYSGINLLTYIIFDFPFIIISPIRYLISQVFNIQLNKLSIPVNSLDSIIGTKKQINFIKIYNQDFYNLKSFLQGYENHDYQGYNAIYGMRKIIEKYHPKILFNLSLFFHDEYYQCMTKNSKNFLKRLNQFGYKIYEAWGEDGYYYLNKFDITKFRKGTGGYNNYLNDNIRSIELTLYLE